MLYWLCFFLFGALTFCVGFIVGFLIAAHAARQGAK